MRTPWRKLAAGLALALGAAVAALVPPAHAASGIIIAMFILGALIVSAFIVVDMKKARAIDERTAEK